LRKLVSFFVLMTVPTIAFADVRHLSIMPDPRGEFIRLCAPFMVSRYAHPEAVCDCLLGALRTEVEDEDIYDALLYGVTERGVPNLTSTWLPTEKRFLISRTMTAIAEPTMDCMFSNGPAKKVLEGIPPSSFGPMPIVQDLTP
jgi:hypothetical protein